MPLPKPPPRAPRKRRASRKSVSSMAAQNESAARKRRTSLRRGKELTVVHVDRPLAFARFRDSPLEWLFGERDFAKRLISTNNVAVNAIVNYKRANGLLQPWQLDIFEGVEQFHNRCFIPYVLGQGWMAVPGNSVNIRMFTNENYTYELETNPLRNDKPSVQVKCYPGPTALKEWPLKHGSPTETETTPGSKVPEKSALGFMLTSIYYGNIGLSVNCTSTLVDFKDPSRHLWEWRGVLRHKPIIKPNLCGDMITGFVRIPPRDGESSESMFIYGQYGIADIIPVDPDQSSEPWKAKISRLRSKTGLSRFTWSHAGAVWSSAEWKKLLNGFDPYGTILAAEYINGIICLTMVNRNNQAAADAQAKVKTGSRTAASSPQFFIYILEIDPLWCTIERFGRLVFAQPILSAAFYSFALDPRYMCWMAGHHSEDTSSIIALPVVYLVEKTETKRKWVAINTKGTFICPMKQQIRFFDQASGQATDLLMMKQIWGGSILATLHIQDSDDKDVTELRSIFPKDQHYQVSPLMATVKTT